MTITVSKSTFIANIYRNFYDVVNAVSSLTGNIYPSMPDFNLNDIKSYPIIILESPQTGFQQFSIGKNLSEGIVNFQVYSPSAKTRDEIVDNIVNAIETNKGVLSAVNLHQVNVDRITYDEIARGKIKVNMAFIPVKFKFYSDKTIAY